MIVVALIAWIACGLSAAAVITLSCMIEDGIGDVAKQIQKYWAETLLIAAGLAIGGPLSIAVVGYYMLQVWREG